MNEGKEFYPQALEAKIEDLFGMTETGNKTKFTFTTKGHTFFICILMTLLILFVTIIFDVPILRQVVGFLVITFIPGNLILKILQVRNLGIVKNIIYSVGLSIAFVMFAGFCVNLVFPYFGIMKPISPTPVICTITSFTFVLGTIAYFRNRPFPPSQIFDVKYIINYSFISPLFFLILLPILAILGALLVTIHQNNLMLMVLIPLITLVPILIGFKKFIPFQLYPLAVVTIALSLLFQQTLISPYLTGYDIHSEYYYQGLVLINGHWDSSIAHNLNAMLSISMLCPIYSIILNMDAVWVFKIIYPLIFSLVPLALFETFKEYLVSRKAFLASFFFMSMGVFFIEMTQLARQQIAELFFSLLLLLIIERKLRPLPKAILAVIYIFSLTVSHYGLAYTCLGIFIIGWIFLFLQKNKTMINWQASLFRRFIGLTQEKEKLNSEPNIGQILTVLGGKFVILFAVFLLTWYMFTSSGSAFNNIIYIGENISTNLFQMVSPSARESLIGTAIGLDLGQVSSLGKLFRIIQYITQLLIIVGLSKLIFYFRKSKNNIEYVALSVASIMVLFACMILPYFSSYLNVTRFYHISLFILAPLFILGSEVSWNWAITSIKYISVRFARELVKPVYSTTILLLILIIYYLFNTGFIFEVTRHKYVPGEIPNSMSLSNYRVDYTDYYWAEAAGGRWLAINSDNKIRVYGDEFSSLLLMDTNYDRITKLPFNNKDLLINTYIFLRQWNIENAEIFIVTKKDAQTKVQHIHIEEIPWLADLLKSKDLVYNNGNTQILAH